MITDKYIDGKLKIEINGVELLPDKSQKVWNHSPDGFSAGYSGSGPAQLALAILLEFTDQVTVIRLYQEFKSDVIAGLKGNFELPTEVVERWIKERLK